MEQLPRSVQEIASVVGTDKTLFLIGKLPRCYSGAPGKQSERVPLYVPTVNRLKPDHPLATILGWDAAVKLCRSFGGEILQPANCTAIYRPFRDQAITRLVMEGVPVAMAAAWFEVSERHVKNLTREIPQEERRPANLNNPPSSHTRKRRRRNEKRQTA